MTWARTVDRSSWDWPALVWPAQSWQRPTWAIVESDRGAEPITPAELLAWAKIIPGDEQPELLSDCIRAARDQIERDTGLALISRTVDAYSDVLPLWTPVELPAPPVQTVESIDWRGVDQSVVTIDPSAYTLDLARRPARLLWQSSAAGWSWPIVGASFTAWHLSMTVGFTPETLPPRLKQLVATLAAYFLTTGRDLVLAEARSPVVMPLGYWEGISVFRIEGLA